MSHKTTFALFVPTEIGRYLRKVRKDEDLPLESLAATINAQQGGDGSEWTKSRISRYETGKVQMQYEQFHAIATALDIDPSQVLVQWLEDRYKNECDDAEHVPFSETALGQFALAINPLARQSGAP